MPPLFFARRRYPAIIASAVALLALSALFSACATQQASGKAVGSPASGTYHMDGPSMLPTLRSGQVLAVQPYEAAQPRRGDVIVFKWPRDTSEDFVKRVIGLPGETIRVDADGAVYINGTRLNEPYLSSATNPFQPNTWVLGNNQYFVMGDNRADSSDSRDWGPILRSAIIGRVTVV
jgi:signal peptidase I